METYFQTIESILKRGLATYIQGLDPDFQTIESILKRRFKEQRQTFRGLFPDY